jgi:acetyl-CoA synthetase
MLYPPKKQAHSYIPSRADYEAVYAASMADPSAFWLEQARALSWFHPPETGMEAD